MIQRRGSQSSIGSSTGGARRPDGLQRQNSTGSMTERTFRDPSPSRPATPRSNVNDKTPPVPAVPIAYVPPPPLPDKSSRRPASVEPPQRVLSPPPKQPGGRGVSLDRGPGVMTARPKKTSANKNANLNSVNELDRAGNRGSVNFSRPMSPQNGSPVSPLKADRSSLQPGGSMQSNTAAPLSSLETQNIEHSLQATANRPAKKKKKKVIPHADAEGSHLANGQGPGRLTGTAVTLTPDRQTASNQSTPSPSYPYPQPTSPESSGTRPKKKKPRQPSLSIQSGSDVSDSDTASDYSRSSDKSRTYNTRAARLLTKQPSIVREDREAEENEDIPAPKVKGSSLSPQNSKDQSSVTQTSQLKEPNRNQTQNPSPGQPKQAIGPKKTSHTDTNMPGSALEAGGLSDERSSRKPSLSPNRSARFSVSPSYESSDSTKHSPLPRSVSPAKSAMKHSPSAQSHSPGDSTRSSQKLSVRVPSEASDTTSGISDEGLRSAQLKQKKSARVSFDDQFVAVGRAASPPTSPDSPVLQSPQNKEAPKRNWFNLGRDRKQSRSDREPTPDDVIKPTPALPSFGSVRGRRDVESTTSTASTIPASHAAGPSGTTENVGSSGDHAVGSILAQAFSSKQDDQKSQPAGEYVALLSSSDPLPPEVTSVEGSGYHSDSDDSVIGNENANRRHALLASNGNIISSGKTVFGAKDSSESAPSDDVLPESQNQLVPSISVQPATPGLDESQSKQIQVEEMPGQFRSSSEILDRDAAAVQPIAAHHATEPTPGAAGIAEPPPDATAASHGGSHPIAGEVAQSLQQQTMHHQGGTIDETDTDNSVYSDAAEDLSDLEGDGFGSINAIVESPRVSNVKSEGADRGASSDGESTPTQQLTPKDSTFGKRAEPVELVTPISQEGWDQAQAYWSGLTQERKKELEKASTVNATETNSPQAILPKPKKKKKKAAVAQDESSSVPVAPSQATVRSQVDHSDTPRIQPGKKNLRSSEKSAETFSMRSTMRGPKGSQTSQQHLTQPSSLNATPPNPKGNLQKRNRPVSAAAMVDYHREANPGQGHGRASSAGVVADPSYTKSNKKVPKAATVKPKTPQTYPNDSDSGSSFRKARPTASDSNRYTMKKSMRGSSVDERPKSSHAAARSGTFSLRSNSPAESTSRRPFSSAGPGMRTSLRGSMDAPSGQGMRTSLRGSMESTRQRPAKSPTRSFGFGKGAKSKPTPTEGSRFSSRYDDSSDDDIPSLPKSRYADSSDEEATPPVPKLTPVRGIPRRIDEGDSTELEDSTEEKAAPEREKEAADAPKANTAEGFALKSKSLRSHGPGVVSQNDALVPQRSATEKPKRSFFGMGKRRTSSQIVKADVDSTPRKEPLSLQTQPKPDKVMGPASSLGPGSPTVAASPKSPKLQRRNTPNRFASDAWPLPQSPASTQANTRPSTSSGAPLTARPDLGTRRTTVQTEALKTAVAKHDLDTPPSSVVDPITKKKRFGRLRKAFGLHD